MCHCPECGGLCGRVVTEPYIKKYTNGKANYRLGIVLDMIKKEGEICHLSDKDLGAITGIGDRQITRYLRRLRESGKIEVGITRKYNPETRTAKITRTIIAKDQTPEATDGV